MSCHCRLQGFDGGYVTFGEELKEKVLVQSCLSGDQDYPRYILMPLWKEGLLFYSLSKNDSNDEPQPSSDDGKKEHECVNKDSGIDDQERLENITTLLALLEATRAYDIEDFVAGRDMNNLESSMPVSPITTTRVHKDHLVD
ncbi:hypothetical protein Tco_0731789 [Tanacetum coccineum]